MNDIAMLQQLIDELLRGIQDVLQSGEQLSDQFQGMIAEELNWLTNRIDELSQQNPVDGLPANPTPEPQMNQGMDSSNVYGFGYDPKNERLLVKFNGKDQRDDGPVYGYDKVPKVIFDLFQQGAVPARTDGSNRWGRWWRGKVPSLGASLYTLIKNGPYPYQRLG